MSKTKKRSQRPSSGVEIQDEFDEALLAADQLVQEYLAFRGFTQTLVSFDAERSGDKKYTFNGTSSSRSQASPILIDQKHSLAT